MSKRTSIGYGEARSSNVGKRRKTGFQSRVHRVFTDLMWPGRKFIMNEGWSLNYSDNTNARGHCSWGFFPLTHPKDLDVCTEVVANTTTLQNIPGWLKSQMVRRTATYRMRNNGRHHSKVEVYVAWPKRDVPRMTDAGSDGKTPTPLDVCGVAKVAATYTAAPAQNAAFFIAGFNDSTQNGTVVSSNVPAYNDYSATPYMSSTLTAAFRIKKLGTRIMAPSSEWDVHLKGRDITVAKEDYMLTGIASAHQAYAISDVYAYTKTCGPLLIVKVTGTPDYDSATAGNFIGENNMDNIGPGSYAVHVAAQRSFYLEYLFGATAKSVTYLGLSFRGSGAGSAPGFWWAAAPGRQVDNSHDLQVQQTLEEDAV